MKDGKEIFRGTQKEVKAIADKLKGMSDDLAEKYLVDLVERKKLDDFINNQNFKFRKLGYKFVHTFKRAKDGVLDIEMFLKGNNNEIIFQGMSTINNDVLENVFIITIQKSEVSTAMYKLLDKIGFNKVVGTYLGNGSLNTNYVEFMKVFKSTNDKLLSAYATPAGKALNKALDNKFKPELIEIDELNKKITVIWTKK